MGRGRAKAKQTKVARELKYRSSTSTDLDALRAELAGGSHQPSPGTSAAPFASDSDDDGDETSSAYSSDGAFDDEAEDDWLPSPRRN